MVGDTLTYSSTGDHLYHNDFIVTRQDYDVSDITVTFEATGTFRTDYGYIGPMIAFTRPGNVHNSVIASGTIGVTGSYSWEPGKNELGFSMYDYKGQYFVADRFIDYGDNKYRTYTIRIKDGNMTLTMPERHTYNLPVPDARPGLRLPLTIAMRQYDQGKIYSVSIRNLKITQ